MSNTKKSKCFTCNKFTESKDYKCVECGRFKLHDTITLMTEEDE